MQSGGIEEQTSEMSSRGAKRRRGDLMARAKDHEIATVVSLPRNDIAA